MLYGSRAAPGQSNLMREIAFFDSNAGDIPKWLKALRAAKELAAAPFAYQAERVPITGTVITDAFRSKLPYFDAIFNSPDLYRKAHGAFGLMNRLHRVKLDEEPDLVHWTYPLPLHIKGVPNVYTLHDLVPLRLPYTTLDNKRRYMKLVSRIAKSADHIVTVSESAKQDITQLLGVEPERITNTYQAVDIPEKYAESAEVVQREVEGTFGLEYQNYYLFWARSSRKRTSAERSRDILRAA